MPTNCFDVNLSGVEHVPSDDEEGLRVPAEEAEEALDATEDHPFKRKRKKEQTGNVEVRTV